jgi:hypothetical protein
MSGAAPDLIAGYLEELHAGLRVPAAEADLIAAEAEDHLRETAAAGMAIGMTELEAQQAAISSFGPVRAVVQAHRRRTVTAGGVAMAAWKLAALLATTVGVGGLAGMGIFTYLLRSAPGGPGPVLMVLVIYAAMAAAGLVLLVARRMTGRRNTGRDRLSPEVTASCFLLASGPLVALIVRLIVTGKGMPIAPALTVSWATPLSAGSVSEAPLVSGALVAGCLAVAVGYGLVAALRRARRWSGSGALGRVLGVPVQADRGGAGRAYV